MEICGIALGLGGLHYTKSLQMAGGLWRMMVAERKLGEMKFQLGQAGQLGACKNWPNSHIS